MPKKPEAIPLFGVDKVYVLTVKAFDERIKHITTELGKYNIDFEFIFDFDIPEITEKDLSIFSPSNMEMAHKSLVLKNIAVWKKMAAESIQRALILEDDAILDESFRTDLEDIIKSADTLPPGHLIFLGGSDTKLPKGFLNHPFPLVPRRMTTADGFVIDSTLIFKRLEWLKHNKINLPADGLMCKIDADINAPHFWPKKSIVRQASCTGKFQTTLDGSRSKHSLLYIKLRFHWHKFKNQSVKRWLQKL
ncbi:3-deoxy-D-manno-octulosonic-acid transferase [gamma proteobacterium IMCC1989]|nr:3-deoxy-D-manno-octulosonic-acid transferase [gamma proteobacterium IMCC1989]